MDRCNGLWSEAKIVAVLVLRCLVSGYLIVRQKELNVWIRVGKLPFGFDGPQPIVSDGFDIPRCVSCRSFELLGVLRGLGDLLGY